MESRDDPLLERLSSLEQFDTYSTFSYAFGQLMAVWTTEAGEQAVPMRRLLTDFLDNEIRYHGALAALEERESAGYQDLRSIADKRRIALEDVAESLEGTVSLEGRAEVVRHLLLAECLHHLHQIPQVVRELETAVEAGGRHPLVYFALGYNRFIIAAELHRQQVAGDRELDEEIVRGAALSAVEAFQEGLSGEVFDAQLHFWAGQALKLARLDREARAAVETALRIDPGILARVIGVAEDELAEGDEETEEAEEAVSDEGPITREEAEEAQEMFRRSWRPEDLLNEPEQ